MLLVLPTLAKIQKLWMLLLLPMVLLLLMLLMLLTLAMIQELWMVLLLPLLLTLLVLLIMLTTLGASALFQWHPGALLATTETAWSVAVWPPGNGHSETFHTSRPAAWHCAAETHSNGLSITTTTTFRNFSHQWASCLALCSWKQNNTQQWVVHHNTQKLLTPATQHWNTWFLDSLTLAFQNLTTNTLHEKPRIIAHSPCWLSTSTTVGNVSCFQLQAVPTCQPTSDLLAVTGS